ncbi:uncharacterized protein SAPINGB_P005606 [Magnusiomyces paraingens]|uniref:Uncharacterized protein n=1 Tax=Magnusiomyces paraingens TaxID=2606893 RepID=A0A5E8C0K7_9ASCO|nr:uncharacterized protein SAPINGB_P005606 [Saprochaete ingens]VVT57244.1 unnamed protein product [Saprochaete ingens]
MIRKIASRRLAASSALTHRATALPKSSPAAAKRFGHGHHDPEYPPESLFNKTSIFLVAFTTFTTALLLNDKFNSKTGKSIIGDWLVPSTKVEETEKNWEQGVAELEKFRKDKLFERSITEKPQYTVPSNINAVAEVGPRSIPTGRVVLFDDVSERTQR